MSIALRKQINADTEFGLWAIEETESELYQQLKLERTEEMHLHLPKNSIYRLHWLATRVLLRHMLGVNKYVHCTPDPHGKPQLSNISYNISLSHSHDYAAVIISKRSPVGIDIEQIHPKLRTLSTKYMTITERSFTSHKHELEHLCCCWSAKEAVYKCYGRRGIYLLKNILLEPFTYRPSGSFKVKLIDKQQLLHFQVSYLQFQNYIIAYVVG